ncbi:MAG TPA: hypothetical protein VFF30_13755 [Nitrososphaerales archaeon]|nr:hypothetical protein [Nitrososphaerales archaeon]
MSSSSAKDFLDKVVPHVRAGGARNIVELAKALKMPVETTRYKVKGMLKQGLEIHASVDYSKFGLRHYYAYLKLSEKGKAWEKKLFALLGEQGCLSSCAKRLPSNEYACKFTIPISSEAGGGGGGSLKRMLRGLSEEKLIGGVPEVHSVSWERSHMIQPEFFDLKHGSWKIDWSKIKKEPLSGAASTTSSSYLASASSSKASISRRKEEPEPEFDELDLMICRQLESDALTRLSEIASSLKTTLNNVFYHFHKHITEGRLLDEYVIRWNGIASKQSTMYVQLYFSDLSFAEEKIARGVIRKLPFLWSDALSLDTGFYAGEAMVPQDSYLDMLSFLSGSLGDAASKLKVLVLDARNRQQYALPVQLFKNHRWNFDPDQVVEQASSKLKRS